MDLAHVADALPCQISATMEEPTLTAVAARHQRAETGRRTLRDVALHYGDDQTDPSRAMAWIDAYQTPGDHRFPQS